MCGIFGYVGPGEARTVILDGLKRLEYRGYDSAGVAVVHDDQLVVRRAEGKLGNLISRIAGESLHGHYGVGHTRWATHGRPNEENAHPHRDCSGRIVVVHNGIIENYAGLKSQLILGGHRFVTQTDTEVVAHLIEDVYQGDLADALVRVAPRLEGNFAVVLMAIDSPDMLVATRRGPNLVFGLDEDAAYLSSDLPALLGATRRKLDIEDGEIAVLRRGAITVLGPDGSPRERASSVVEWDAQRAEKGGFKHFMLKEIREQSSAIRDTLVGRFDLERSDACLDELSLGDDVWRRLRRVNFVACGTAYLASQIGRVLVERLARVPAEVELASEFRTQAPFVDPGFLTIAVTQSGETADTLAAMRLSRSLGAPVLAVCNVRGSLATREATATLLTHAGPEIGVASTKAFSAQITALALLAVRIGRARGTLDVARAAAFLTALTRIPHLVEETLASTDGVELLARRFVKADHFLYLGRGLSHTVAMEGALKLKEISYIHAEGYAAGEMKHGPIALIDEHMPVVVVAPRDDVRAKTISNLQEVRARGGVVIAIGNPGDDELAQLADTVLTVPETDPLLTPFLTVLPLQLLAYHLADLRGCDVDQPRNLAKSVTVE